jgi:hypothetical protein
MWATATNPDQAGLIPNHKIAIVIDLDLKYVIPAKTKKDNEVFRGRKKSRARGDGGDQKNSGAAHPGRDPAQDLVPPR